MLEKLSVRKPFTVLVGVILVIVLGIVSFMNTTTELLPEMDLPFSAIVTTYIGATPEQVERDISIPMETRMSTLSGIEMVQSISSEHFSMMILQFTETTNMDSASLEIREALDMMSLPEGASRPMTIRMNPEMLPIMTANVHMAGVNIEELSEFVRYEVAPAIEGVPGVAVANFSGLVQNQLHVIIQQERIDAVNQEIAAAAEALMEAAIAEAMAEMQQQAEAIITAQVEEFSETRMAELMADGLTMEEAVAQLQAELPIVTQAITEEVMAAMAGDGVPGAGETPNADHTGADGAGNNGAPGTGDTAAAPGAAGTASNADTQAPPQIGIPAAMLTVETISGMLFAQNFAMPAGMITDYDTEYMVRVGDRFESVDEIKDMLIFDPAQMGLIGAAPVRLSDVAVVFVTDDSHLSFTRVNGNPSVMLSIQRQSEFPTAEVASAVRDRMDLLTSQYDGLGFSILMDQGEMIGVVVGSVLDSLIMGGILAILILLLFLRDLRPTLIVAAAIPLSLMLAFTLMYFTGVSINMISMSGLALAVGMLVDNAIVVIENIYRMRRTTDRSAARAALSGARQLSGAIAAASLTTVSVFIPIVFTTGITRQLFTDLALTITYALLASLIIALTVIPAASSVMLKNVKREQEGRFFTRFIDGYEKSLRFALRFKWAVMAIAIVTFVVSLWAIGRQGTEMFPAMDMGQISVTAEMPEGSTFDETTAIAEEFSNRVFAIPEVETVGVSVGGGGMMGMLAAGMGMGDIGGGPSTTITMYVILEQGRNISGEDISAEIREIGYDLGTETSVDGGGMDMMMGGAQISLRVEGRELDDIRDTAIALSNLVNSVEGTLNVTDIAESAAPEMRISVDKDAAMAQGLTVAQVFMAVNSVLTAQERTVNMHLGGRSYEIIISDGDFTPPDAASLPDLQIETAAGYVTLSSIAEIYEDTGFTTISRINRNRFVTITGELEDGFNVGLVNAEIERLLEDFTPIGDSRVIIGGDAEAIADAFSDLFLMLALAIVFIYLIMVAQFQSLRSPFIIMLSIPLAFTGGFAALIIAGMPLSVVAMIGLILLTGVITNTGIVFITRVNQMRAEGLSKVEAIIDAGRKRIRPVLMTEISTIFAMSVMALGIGEGTEMMQPMAIATIGGLVYATAMILFVIPVMYDLLHRNKDVTVKDDLNDESNV